LSQIPFRARVSARSRIKTTFCGDHSPDGKRVAEHAHILVNAHHDYIGHTVEPEIPDS
jgi:hypothetical protein